MWRIYSNPDPHNNKRIIEIIFLLTEDTAPKGKRHTWSSDEDATVKKFFSTYINDVSESGNKGKLQGTAASL
jgi:hypothetical protein